MMRRRSLASFCASVFLFNRGSLLAATATSRPADERSDRHVDDQQQQQQQQEQEQLRYSSNNCVGGTRTAALGRALQKVRTQWADNIKGSRGTNPDDGGVQLPTEAAAAHEMCPASEEETPLPLAETNASVGRDNTEATPDGAAETGSGCGLGDSVKNCRDSTSPGVQASSAVTAKKSNIGGDRYTQLDPFEGGTTSPRAAADAPCPEAVSDRGRGSSKSREGWRVGEGIAVPADGADAIWDQLKTMFERRRAIADMEASVHHNRDHLGKSRGPASQRMKERGNEKGRDDVLGGACAGRVCDDSSREKVNRATAAQVTVDLPERREAVVDAVRWAWAGYTKHAWGKDELMPLTRRGKDSFGLGLTIVDSMDTLWLAGEKTSFAECVEWVSQSMDVGADRDINVFETTIRVLGGLLAAYHLSGERGLLSKAEDLGLRLAKAFASPSGIPFSDVNLKSGRGFTPPASPGSSLSEATTLQLEFSYLSQVTGNLHFHESAQRASDAIETAREQLGWDGSGKEGLAPVYVDPIEGVFQTSGGSAESRRITLGARGDSYYEYLLKQWIFSGKRDTQYLERYQAAVRGVEASLLQTSYPERLTFVGELEHGRFKAKMDHLVCFLPGTLAIGHHEGAAGEAGDRHLELARDLMETCVQMYESTATGLAPEIVHFNTDPWNFKKEDDIIIKPMDAHNILRPETLESLYYLYWVTREEGYRDSAWAIFQAFERHCRVDRGGYAGLQDVTDVKSRRINKMETFFLSESLKYLLLIFSDENPMPYDRYVFNTEAHAFPILAGAGVPSEPP